MKKGYASKENLAYNLELFEPKTRPHIIKPEKKMRIKTKTSFISMKSVALFIICVVTVGFILTGYAKVSEYSSESASLQKQLSKLEAEERRLTLEMEKKTSLKAIDDIAKKQLNMSQVQSYQIEYVSANKSDKTQILKTSPLSTVIAAVSEGISSVKEYLK